MSELVFLLPLIGLYLLSLVILVAQIRPSRPDTTRRLPAAPDASHPVLRLWIEGTQRAEACSVGFLGRFGLDARTVRDLRVYDRGGSLGSFPSRLTALLFDLYMQGALRGAEMTGLLFHGRSLGDGEAVYFALVDLPPEPSVVAFIDRRRVRSDRVAPP
jgi:hypothetical protein